MGGFFYGVNQWVYINVISTSPSLLLSLLTTI